MNLCRVHKDDKCSFDNQIKLSISRNTMQYNSIPNRFNCRKSNRLCYSLDGGLDKWDDKEINKISGSNISEPVLQCNSQSSNLVDDENVNNVQISALTGSNITNLNTEDKKESTNR